MRVWGFLFFLPLAAISSIQLRDIAHCHPPGLHNRIEYIVDVQHALWIQTDLFQYAHCTALTQDIHTHRFDLRFNQNESPQNPDDKIYGLK